MRTKILLGGIVVLLTAISSEAVLRIRQSHQAPPRPKTLAEKILDIKNVSYEDASPYFDAMFVFRDRHHLAHCGDDNLTRLPHVFSRRWVAIVASTDYAMRWGNHKLSKAYEEAFPGSSRVGDSPWGIFQLPRVRSDMEPIFEDAKTEIIQRLRDEDAEMRSKATEEPKPLL